MIVLTNGCFDLLHAGHVTLLRTCRHLADAKGGKGRVVVAVNTDESVSRCKPGRPFVPLRERTMMLLALKYVDEVIPFDTETDLEAHIQRIGPDILVKGSDWRGKKITGSDLVERVEFVPLEGNFSTTRLSEHIFERLLVAKAPDISGG